MEHMVELDEKAAGIIKNLLDQDLSKRKEGLDDLRDATYNNWDIKYREYLWKAIEEEKSKSFQKSMVKFAIQKMGSDSLRKMIRFIENNDLHTGSTSYVSKRYMELEDDIVREALIKSLQRDLIFITQFVLRLLNEFEFYQNYNNTKYSSLIRDILTDPVPIESKREFLIRIMNWYFRGTTRLMHRAKIWDLIAEDSSLYKILLDVFYLKVDDHGARFVKPSYYPRLLPFKKMRNFSHHRSDKIYSWIQQDSALDLLYNTSDHENTELRNRYVDILANLPIPEFDFNPTRDGAKSNIYQVWDMITKNDADKAILEVEEFEREYFLPIFPELQDNPELKPEDIFQGLNPHALFYMILRYLPRYLLSLQLDHASFDTTKMKALQSLSQGKYWTEQNNDHLLSIEIIGSPQIWKNIISSSINILSDEASYNVRVAATDLLYYLTDLIHEPPELTSFWDHIRDEFQKLKQPVYDFTPAPSLTELDSIDAIFVPSLQDILDIEEYDDGVHQELISDVYQSGGKYIKDIQSIVDNLLEGQNILANIDRDLIKFHQTLQPLQTINYWYYLLIQHFKASIHPIQSFSSNHKGHFDLYLKRLGELSEYFRELLLIIGDPTEISGQITFKRELKDIKSKISRKIRSLGLSPYKYLNSGGSDSIMTEIDRALVEMVDQFDIIDPSNLQNELQEYLEEIQETIPPSSSYLYRIQAPDQYTMDQVDKDLKEGEIFQLASYLLRMSDDYDLIDLFHQLFNKLGEKYQIRLMEIYYNLSHFGFIAKPEMEEPDRTRPDRKTRSQSKNQQDVKQQKVTSFPQIFIKSKYVKVRTKTALLLR